MGAAPGWMGVNVSSDGYGPYRIGHESQGLTQEGIERASAETRRRLRAILGCTPPGRGTSEDEIRQALGAWIEPLYGDGKNPGSPRDLGDRLLAVVLATDAPEWERDAQRHLAWLDEKSAPTRQRAAAVGGELASAAGHIATSRVSDDETAAYMIAVAAYFVGRAWTAHLGRPLEPVQPWVVLGEQRSGSGEA